MRHRSRRPVLDSLATLAGAARRRRAALALAALCVAGAGAAVAATGTGQPTATPSPSSSGTATGSLPVGALPERTQPPTRGHVRSAATPTTATPTPSSSAPRTATPQAEPTPGTGGSRDVRTQVDVRAPGASASLGASTTTLPSPPTGSSAPTARAASSTPGTAPDTSISTVSTDRDTATFRLGGPAGSSFQCSVDGASYAACGQVVTLTGLAPGWHTLSARAVDGAGRVDPTPASTRWHANGAPQR